MPSNDEKPPFDSVKASFFLVAGIFAVYSIVIMYSIVICSMYAPELLAHSPVGVSPECVREGRIYEALGTLLASALAFAAGRTSK